MAIGTVRTGIVLLLATLGFAAVTYADAADNSASRAFGQDLKLEGVWARPGSVTLVKQFHNYLAVYGKDEASAWQARCVLGTRRITCRGNGTTTTGYEFVYESVITPDGSNLKDSWRAVFPGDQELRGEDTLRPITVPPAELARK